MSFISFSRPAKVTKTHKTTKSVHFFNDNSQLEYYSFFKKVKKQYLCGLYNRISKQI